MMSPNNQSAIMVNSPTSIAMAAKDVSTIITELPPIIKTQTVAPMTPTTMVASTTTQESLLPTPSGDDTELNADVPGRLKMIVGISVGVGGILMLAAMVGIYVWYGNRTRAREAKEARAKGVPVRRAGQRFSLL